MSNNLDSDQNQHYDEPDLDPICLHTCICHQQTIFGFTSRLYKRYKWQIGRLLMIFPNYLNHDQNGQKYGPDPDRKGAQWLSGRVLNSRPRGRRFEPHPRHCVVSLSKNINPSLVLVQPRKTRPFKTERLLMGRKESNQTSPNLCHS